MVPVPFLPTHICSVRLPHRLTCNWHGQPSVAPVAELLFAARVEPPSVARAVESLSAAHVERPSAGRAAEQLLSADATTEAFGMAPEGASGTGVGGHMVLGLAGDARQSASCGFAGSYDP